MANNVTKKLGGGTTDNGTRKAVEFELSVLTMIDELRGSSLIPRKRNDEM